MSRFALLALVTAASVAAALGAITFFNARDDATTGVGGEISAPGRPASNPSGLEPLLRAGNVVIEHPGTAATERELRALADEISGSEDLAALRDAGQAVELRDGATNGRITARAWERALTTSDPSDPALRAFVEHWLGRGAQ